MTLPAYSVPPQAVPVTPLPPYVGPVTPSTCAADTLTLWNFLPQYVKDGDADQGYQFLTWLDGIGKQQQIIDDIVRDTPAGPGWSILLDVTRCPTYALPWLGQFLGIRFNGAQINSDAAMRAIISSQGNFGRGATAAIKSVISPFLKPGGAVNIIERYPDAYSLTIIITGAINVMTYAELAKDYPLYSEMVPGNPPYPALPTYANFPSQSTTEIIDAVNDAIPAGLITTIIFN